MNITGLPILFRCIGVLLFQSVTEEHNRDYFKRFVAHLFASLRICCKMLYKTSLVAFVQAVKEELASAERIAKELKDEL